MAVTFRPTTQYEPGDICAFCRDPFAENNPPLAHDKGETHLLHRSCTISVLHQDPRCLYCRADAVLPEPETEEEKTLVLEATALRIVKTSTLLSDILVSVSVPYLSLAVINIACFSITGEHFLYYNPPAFWTTTATLLSIGVGTYMRITRPRQRE